MMILLFHLITSARDDIVALSKSIPIPPAAALFAFLQVDVVINMFPKKISMRVSPLCTILWSTKPIMLMLYFIQRYDSSSCFDVVLNVLTLIVAIFIYCLQLSRLVFLRVCSSSPPPFGFKGSPSY